MFDPLRSKEDVIRDIRMLNEICDEREYYEKMWAACVMQHNLKMKECKHKDAMEKIRCEKCKGTGYIAEKGKEK